MQTCEKVTNLKATVALLTAVLLGVAGCSKSIQSDSGSKGFEQPEVQAKADDKAKTAAKADGTGAASRGSQDKSPKEEFPFPRGGQETPQNQPPQIEPPQTEPQQTQPQQIEPPQIGSLPAETTRAPESKSGDVRVSEGIAMAKAGPSDAMPEQQGGQLSAAQDGLMDVFFAFDSWKLSDDGKQALARDAEWLKANGQQKLAIEGYCDERGTQAYNLVLGQKRAKAVQGYLMELGVPDSRMTVISYGKDRPFCREQTEDCYQQNRRGHLVVGGK